ncbi:hypothetical protein MNBD_NITROSPIRAE02-511, partial [hydrothermal vent metagenome]
MGTFVFMSLGIVSGLLYHEHLWRQVTRAGSGKRYSVFYNFWTRYLVLAAVMLSVTTAAGNHPLFLFIGVLLGRPLYLYIFRRRLFRLRGVPKG